MDTRYKRSHRVYVGSIGKYKVIEDIEIFDGLIIYYMSDVTAYPEKDLFENQLHYLCHRLIDHPLSEEDQEKILSNI